MVDYSGYQYIKVEKENGIATVTLNRPEALNAANPGLISELGQTFGAVSRDEEVNVVVVTGAGRAFCAGGDIKEMNSRASSSEHPWAREGRRGDPILPRLLEVEQPIIAAVNGPAVGLGATIALFCDIVIAAEDARIADPHVRVGLVAGDGGPVIWPLLVGLSRAKEYLLTGDFISAREAERIGLINHAVPRDQFWPTVMELAHRLASGPQLAIRWTKLSVNKRLREQFNLIQDTSSALERLSMRTEDHAEAARAWVEKRAPQFTGR